MTVDIINLKSKITLVTGATHGIGMAIARGLHSAGATLVINDIDAIKLKEAIQKYEEQRIYVHGYLCDVTNENQVVEMLDQIEKEVGYIDILVNNAGVIKRIPAIDLDIRDWQQVLNVDLNGPFIMSKHIAKRMIERGSGGKIITCVR